MFSFLFVFFTVASHPHPPSPSSPLHPQHLLQPLQLQLPVGDRMLDRQSGGSGRVLSSSSSSSCSCCCCSSAFSSSASSLFLRSLELGPDRRGELRARRGAPPAPSVTCGSPRGHPEEGPVQVERLGPQHKVLEVERGRGRPGSRRARRHRGKFVDQTPSCLSFFSLFPTFDLLSLTNCKRSTRRS